MNLKKGLLFLWVIISVPSFSQIGINLKLGASPWHLVDNIDQLSNPISLAYTGGINIETVFPNSSIGFLSGVDYTYSQPGTNYVDLSDQENILAMIYEDQINKHYIGVTHHEISVPVMMVFYHNGLRSGIGASYSKYFFEDVEIKGTYNTLNDFGLVAMTGARLSKRMILAFGYYYGLKKVVELSPSGLEGVDNPIALKANMQQIRVQLCISLFNNLKDSRYFLAP